MDPIAGRFTPAVKALAIVHTIAFLFFTLVHEAQPFIVNHLLVGPGFWKEPWKLLTSMFVDAYGGEGFGPGFFLMDILGLWLVGGFVERSLGLRRFVVLIFATGMLANLAAGLLSSVFGMKGLYGGLNMTVIALFVAHARIMGKTPTPVIGGLVLKAHHLAMLIVGLALLSDLSRRDVAGMGATLATAGSSYALAGAGGLRALIDGMRARRARQRYRVLEGGAARKPKSRTSEKFWN
jgi:membrane associated rhomboid family serine protease